MKRFGANIAILLVTLVLSLDLTIINTALHDLQRVFSISIIEVQWIINAFGLGLSCFLITMGRAADYWGGKKTLFVGIVLFILASIVAGLSSSVMTIIVARFFLGVSSAILYPVTQLLIYQNYPDNQKKKAMALWVMFMGIGLVLGPFLGGLFVTYYSWRYIFFAPALFLFLGSILLYLFVNEIHVRVTKKVHPLEVFLLALALATLVLAIVFIKNSGFLSWPTISLFCVSIITFIFLIFFEKNLSDPMIPIKLLKNPVFVTSCICSASLSFFIWIVLFLVPFFLQKIHFLTAFQAGLYLLFQAGAVVFSGQIASLIGHLVSAKKLILVSYGVLTTGLALQGFLSFHIVLLAICLALFGLAGPIIQSNSVPLALKFVNKADLGSVLGFIRTAQTASGMIGVAICSSIIASYSLQKAYHITFIMLSVCALVIALLVYWIIPGEKNKTV